MSCPCRPNTWEKVAWLQVRVSSMAVPLDEERESEGDEGRSATLRHVKTGKRGDGEKRRGEEGVPSVVEAAVCDLW